MTASVERRSAERPSREVRHHAREAAVQMLYQWEVGKVSMFEVGQTFWTYAPSESQPLNDDLRAFATRLATGVAGTVSDLDPLIGQAAENWRIERMNVLDRDRKSTRLNSSHVEISYAVFCLKKKKIPDTR